MTPASIQSGPSAARSLGSSLLLLLDVPESVLKKACSKPLSQLAQSPVVHALKTLDDHLGGPLADASACQTILSPLKDKILAKSDTPAKARATHVLRWIHHEQHGGLLLQALAAMLSLDKKTKLAAAQLVECLLDPWPSVFTSPSTPPSISVSTSEPASPRDSRETASIQVLRLLIDIVERDGVQDEDGAILPTRLTSTAAQCAIVLCDYLLGQTESAPIVSTASPSLIQQLEDEESVAVDAPMVEDLLAAMIRLVAALAQLKVETSLHKGALKVLSGVLQSMAHAAPTNALIPDLTRIWAAFRKGYDIKVCTYAPSKFGRFVQRTIDEGTSKSGDIFLSLVTLSMSFSLRKPADLDSIVHQADSKIMETISLSIAPGSSSTVRSLGFHLMRFCLTLRGAETLVSESESLVAILDEADEVSEAAIGLLADCASSHPEAVLPLICGRMDSGSVGKRRNALLVLEEIVSINKGVIQHHRRSGLRDMLCGQLLNRLGDDDIKLRNITTRLFRMLALQLLLPKLTPLLEHTDARIRAAAEASLVLVLSEGRPPTKNIEMFIEFMRNCYCGVADDQNMISPEIRSPNDIRPTGATQTPAKEVADKRLSYQLRVISKWAGALSPESWMETLPVILAKCYSSPGDTVLVRALSAMSAYWTDHNVIGAICRQILDIAVAQPRLTDELLNDPSPDSADQVRGLLFARLSPMLVFKVLSIPAIGSFALRSEAERNQATAECRAKTSMDSCAESIADYRPHQSDSCNEPHGQSRDEGNPDVSNHGDSVADADLCPRLVNEFITRIESTMEYEEVRRLAAELVARFPLELIGDLLVDKFEHSIGEQQWLMARSYVFALCNMIATHQDLSISTVRSTSPLQPQQSTRLVAAALRVMMSSENTADKNTMKSLEAGCLECLALLVSVCSTKRSQQAAVKADAARARIQEIDATDIAAGPATLSPLNDVVDAMLYLCHPLALVEASEPSQPSDEYAALSRSSYFKELYTSLRSICILPQDQRRSPSASGTIRYEVATHFCNAVATAVNHLSPPKSTGTAAQADSESSIRDAKHQGLLWLASRSYRRFLDVAHWASGQVGVFPELDIVGGSCFQTLFRFVYGLRSESDAWIPDTMDVCLVGLRSSGRLIHNHALKLMTACIGTSTKSLADPLRSLQTRKTLEDFVRTTNDPSSKELAQRVMANM